MARIADKKKLEQAVEILNTEPGKKSGTYARKLGVHKEAFNRLLVQLNDEKVLLYEDDDGNIWPCK